jgi:type II secretory pathway pseudopilin PulG
MSYHVIQVVGVALLLAAAISVIVGVVAWPWLRRHTDRTAQGQESQRLRLRQLRLRQLRLRELRLRELRLRQRRKP